MGESGGRGVGKRGKALTEGYSEIDLRIAAYLAAGLTQENTGDAVGLTRISIQNHLKANPWIQFARDIIQQAIQRKITEISLENEEDFKRELGKLRNKILTVYEKGMDAENIMVALNAASKVDNRLHGVPTQKIENSGTVKHEVYQIPQELLRGLLSEVEPERALLEDGSIIDVEPLEDDSVAAPD